VGVAGEEGGVIIFFLPTGEKRIIIEAKNITARVRGKRKILFDIVSKQHP